MHMTQAQEDREWGFLKTLQGDVFLQKIWTQGIDTVFIVGDMAEGNNAGGMVARSIDQGESWEKQLLPVSTLKDIVFIDHNIGYAVGDKGSIVKTSDGGVTWIPLNCGTDVDLNAIAAIGSDSIWVVGGRYYTSTYYTGIVLHSTDGGETWSQPHFFLEEDSKEFTDVAFRDNKGYITCYGAVYKTTDHGENWEKQIVVENDFYRGINITENKAYMLIENDLYFTEDMVNWKAQDVYIYPFSDALFFLNDNLGYHSYGRQIDGSDGDPIVITTADGGRNWTRMKIDYNTMSHPPVSSDSDIRMVNDTLGYAIFYESILKMPKPSNSNSTKKIFMNNNLSVVSPSDKLIIQSPSSIIQSVDLLDISGKILESEKFNNNDLEAEINTGHIPHGMYIIRTSLEGNKIMFNKWIK